MAPWSPAVNRAEAYVRHFYGPAVAREHVAAVGAALPSGLLSVAALQGALMQHPDAPERAADAVASLAAAARQEGSQEVARVAWPREGGAPEQGGGVP